MSQEPDLLKHEALHMCHFFAKCVEDELVDHPEVKNNPEWAELAEKACSALNELYQKIGGSDG